MIKSCFKHILRDQDGATAIEYGLICALIVIAALTAISGFADENNRTWMNVASKSMAATSAVTNN
jgi:pilus assembly protein Flp/PilA